MKIEMRSVSAVFGNHTNRYDYYVPADDSPKVGDMIVTSVEWGDPEDTTIDFKRSGRSFADGCRVATVVSVNNKVTEKAKKFYLWLIPKEALIQRQDSNRNLAEQAKRKAEARDKLDQMMEEFGRMELYRKLAESSPEAKKLLEVLEGQG